MDKEFKEKVSKKIADTIVGSGIFDDIGGWFTKAVDDVGDWTKKATKDAKKTFTKKKGNELARAALPAVGSIVGSVGGPVGSVAGLVFRLFVSPSFRSSFNTLFIRGIIIFIYGSSSWIALLFIIFG